MRSATRGELPSRGRTAEIFAWSDSQVVKLFFDWCPPEWIQREVQAGRRLAFTSLPTPRLIGTVSLDGRHGIIFRPCRRALNAESPKDKALAPVAHGARFAELHSAIHENAGADLPPLRPYLHTSITNANALPSGLKDHALSLLASLPDGEALCHFDFHPDQVAITYQGPMILDWMTAHRGDRLADIARTSVLIRFAQVPFANWLMLTATNMVRRVFYDRYIRHYIRLHPEITRGNLQRWMVPVASARIGDDVPGEQDKILAFLTASLEQPMAV